MCLIGKQQHFGAQRCAALAMTKYVQTQICLESNPLGGGLRRVQGSSWLPSWYCPTQQLYVVLSRPSPRLSKKLGGGNWWLHAVPSTPLSACSSGVPAVDVAHLDGGQVVRWAPPAQPGAPRTRERIEGGGPLRHGCVNLGVS